MRNFKRAISVFAVGGLALGGLAALAPVSGATVIATGQCNNLLALGSAKSTTVGKGVTDADNRDVSVASKGVDPNTKGGTNLGTCAFNSGTSNPDSSKPPIKGYNGFKSVKKWSTKLFSPEADCNTADTADATEWPINGVLAVTFTDLTPVTLKNQALSAQIAVDGFSDPDNDPDTPSDVVEFHGLVTKGVGAGADVTGQTEFDPTFKDSTQTTATPYFGYNFDLGGAIGCTTPAVDDANILLFNNGSVGGNSQLLGLPVAGIQFTIGNP
jgi:hypothetical protein